MAYLVTRSVPLDELTLFPGNAKRGDVEAIRASLRKNGQYRSLVVRAVPNGPLVVLAGNHTMLALKAENRSEARCEIIECDDATARRINLADNRTAELGGYEEDALAALLKELDGDYEGTGWAEEDLGDLFGSVEELPPALDEPDEVPGAPIQAISEPGDVWCLGSHRVLCGDSTDVAAVEAMLDGDRCDCMWTDPPYGIEYVGKTADALTIQNDGAEGLPELLAGAFAVATAALNPGAPVYIASPPGPLHFEFAKAFNQAGWLLRQNLVWVKDVLVLGRSEYHYRHEPILYGFTAHGDGRLGRGGERWYGDNAATTVFEIPKPARSIDHPTMKPVELITRCLGNSCPTGGLVYEPFGGSGSTLIAAHTTGRVARVVELDPRYVDVICRRYQEATGTLPILASTGQPHDFTAL
jgi:site-specific DNA-methyltransferase (adenine-specific)